MTPITNSSFAMQADNALRAGQNMPSFGKVKTIEQARKTAEEFEAMFIGQMLQPLFQNINAEKPFGGGSSEAMWRSMQVDEYGKAIAKAGGIGLADAVFREILKQQEIQ